MEGVQNFEAAQVIYFLIEPGVFVVVKLVDVVLGCWPASNGSWSLYGNRWSTDCSDWCLAVDVMYVVTGSAVFLISDMEFYKFADHYRHGSHRRTIRLSSYYTYYDMALPEAILLTFCLVWQRLQLSRPPSEIRSNSIAIQVSGSQCKDRNWTVD